MAFKDQDGRAARILQLKRNANNNIFFVPFFFWKTELATLCPFPRSTVACLFSRFSSIFRFPTVFFVIKLSLSLFVSFSHFLSLFLFGRLRCVDVVSRVAARCLPCKKKRGEICIIKPNPFSCSPPPPHPPPPTPSVVCLFFFHNIIESSFFVIVSSFQVVFFGEKLFCTHRQPPSPPSSKKKPSLVCPTNDTNCIYQKQLICLICFFFKHKRILGT